MKAVNLLPSDLRGSLKPAPVAAAGEPTGGSGAYAVLGALALGVILLAGYVLSTNTIKQHQADLAELEARSAAVMAESARLKPFADYQSAAQARVATVRDLATQRFDWEQAFGDLARALPQDVSVKSLGASVSSQGGAGGTSSPLRGALDVPAIQIDGCTTGQNAVARTMARLRSVRGVTRVSLQTSAKSNETTASVVDTAAGEAVAGCDTTGGKTPPDFTVVVFFENAAAAAAAPTAAAATAAAGGTAASGSTATTTETPASGADTATTASTTTDGAK